ncbi:glucoamylase family protein [Fodinicola acaciae]|uniref:glucoamylase family protein n=1 Tax=Fodinicola acaciae TaxID=2681555 RepID=UPI0013D1333C|nr:glucoamylase family protein [Fodinicola acaciae]
MRRFLAIVVLVCLLPVPAAASAPPTPMRYAADTWKSMTASVDPGTGLIADNVTGDLKTRSAYTSPTNIGAYLWSTVAARDLGIVSRADAYDRMRKTLSALEKLTRSRQAGMFFNWYDPRTGAVLRHDPEGTNPITPFLSSVDNGWLAAALMVVRAAEPRLRAQADGLLAPMDFGFYYDPNARPGVGGLIHGGFYEQKPSGCSVTGNYRGGPPVYYTCNHYDVLNSEPRIASYLGISRGQIPATHYFALNRTFPPICQYAFKQKPVGYTTTYDGVPVFEGAYTYRGMKFVPTWGGDMFEALMPDLFVPEEKWATHSWAVNHPLYVRGQIEHGLVETGYGYWGFSPASNPKGGYGAYGQPWLGMSPDGYPSDLEGTRVDPGFEGCRPPGPKPVFGDGVVTPHAAFLALPYAPGAVLGNLAKLRENFDAYGPGGFYDSVAVRSGTVAKRYLALDQGMTMAALGNYLARDDIRRAFVRGPVEAKIRPLLAIETFNAGKE